jgi:hypothetical protein
MARLFVTLLCFFYALMLAACNASAEGIESPGVVQSQTVIAAPSETFVVSTRVLSTPTLAVSPTATLETVISASTPTPGPIYEECSQGRYFTVLGNWALCDPLEDPITIINASNEIRQFSYKDYYGEKIANPCTRLHSITGDGKYLYFSLDDGCILTEPGFISSISLLRMDLADGKVSETLPASYNFESSTGNTYSLSLSPTGRRLAYIHDGESPLSLNILDLQTGRNSSYQVDGNYLDGGSFTWSQDGTKLAFMLLREENYDQFISMGFVDLLQDNSLVTFIKDQSYEWIISKVEITSTGIKISPPGEDPLFYEFKSKTLSPIK